MFNGGLGFELAQRIVDNIMTIVPYNINIMDRSGIIIASGNINRINKQHFGAIQALEKREPYYIYEDTELEKKGINVPFRYKNEVVGVIGVSGEPIRVEEIANIVRVTAELMIENQFYDNKAFAQETKIRDLFSDIIAKPNYLKETTIGARAEALDVDLSSMRTAVIYKLSDGLHEHNHRIKETLSRGEYIIRDSNSELGIFYLSSELLDRRINRIINEQPLIEKVFIGSSTSNLYQSYESVKSMARLSELLSLNQKICKIEDYLLEDFSMQIKKTEHIAAMVQRIRKLNKAEVLEETLTSYVRQSFDVQKTCNQLHVHKNTLYYRLQSLTDLTGYHVKNPKDAIVLYMILVNSSL